MIALGPIGFLQPAILAALALLPAIWWLLRATPPSPRRVVFPPTRLLKDLKTTEETPAHTPWWLTLLRMLLAALIIFALARPVLNPETQSLAGTGPLLLVVDNGWAAAAHWPARREAIDAAIDRAAQDGRRVMLAPTAPGEPLAATQSVDQARERAAGLAPQPYQPDRAALMKALESELGESGDTGFSVVWLSDGLDYGVAEDFAEALGNYAGGSGDLRIFAPRQQDGALALRQGTGDSGELVAEVLSVTPGERNGTIRALTGRGELLGQVPFTLEGESRETTATFELPLEIRNQVARIEIAGERSAGAVHLLDGRSRWHRVGIFSGEAQELAQPLLSPLYYVRRALSPYADIVASPEGNIAMAMQDLFNQKASAIVLADIGKLVPGTEQELRDWVEQGGVLIRFAGPRLEQGGDELLPVPLRRGGRSLGGALSWATPQPLASFEETSPFHGLQAPEEVLIRRQVLADPTMSMDAEVWARLADGTPLVTASREGKGMLVLFHVTANPDWSNLPMSGLFVEMLRRVVATGAGVDSTAATEGDAAVDAAPGSRRESGGALLPLQTLDGYGQLISPSARVAAISPERFERVVPGPDHPPGYYGPTGAARALNLINQATELRPLPEVQPGAAVSGYEVRRPVALEPWLYLAAIGVFAADMLAVLLLSSGWRPRRRGTQAAAVLLGLIVFAPGGAFAQTQLSAEDAFALKASLQTHLAYVMTGDPEIDRTSHEGLTGLSKVLTARTSLEPAEPMGVDVDNDELAFFPILYWPVPDNAEPLSDATLAKIDAFMKQGGMIVFDTRDHQWTVTGTGGNQALNRLIGQLDIPPLEHVPEDHVLTKSFYLLQSFPGRYDGGAMWAEAEPESEFDRSERARRTDGVSSILVTSNDLAAAWALDDSNRPLYAVTPGGEVQREMAFRTGINIVMYALTGNYKADQVHVPALLERLGQ
jgi:hypothetical protein